MGIKRCPKCGSVKLLAKKIVGTQIEAIENGEFKLISEGKKYQMEIVGCAVCKESLTESDLIESVPCKKCGKYTALENLNENGECDVCNALASRPELVNMSKEDLIRMMLKLERSTQNNTQTSAQANSIQTSVTSVAEDKMKKAQEALGNTSNDFSEQLFREAKEINEESISEDKRRGRPRKKSLEENVSYESNNTTSKEMNDSVNAISESQEAPFPDKDPELSSVFSDNIQAPEQEIMPPPVPQFNMFDDEQSF